MLVLWEHKGIAPIVRSFGVNKKDLTWPDDDYDTIWIVTYKDSKAIFNTDKEIIKPLQIAVYNKAGTLIQMYRLYYIHDFFTDLDCIGVEF